LTRRAEVHTRLRGEQLLVLLQLVLVLALLLFLLPFLLLPVVRCSRTALAMRSTGPANAYMLLLSGLLGSFRV